MFREEGKVKEGEVEGLPWERRRSRREALQKAREKMLLMSKRGVTGRPRP